MNALNHIDITPFLMILSKANAMKPQKYIISWTDLNTVNTFHSSEHTPIEVVDSMKEVHDYLRWCQLSDGFSTLDEYLTKHPVYIYELPEVRKIKVEGDLT